MLEIKFQEMNALALDLISEGGEFLYLRIAGNEPTVNAIFAYLMAKEHREKSWGSAVEIPTPGQRYNHGIAARKAPYKSIKTQLPNGLVDMAIFHTQLTVAHDSPAGFHILTHHNGIPAGFLERLNASLPIPIKPEWQAQLWEMGQQPHKFIIYETKTKGYGKDAKKTTEQSLKVTTPIIPVTNKAGNLKCFHVHTDGDDRWAWYAIVQKILRVFDLEIPLNNSPQENTDD